MIESFPLGLRGNEGVTLIFSFNFIEVTPPYPLLSQEGDIELSYFLTEIKYNYP